MQWGHVIMMDSHVMIYDKDGMESLECTKVIRPIVCDGGGHEMEVM